MPVAALAVATVAGAAMSSSASSKAAKSQANSAQAASDAQLQATRETNDLQKQIYDQNRADATPWRDAGVGALNQLTGLMQPGGALNRNFTMADFTADPGYQFRMDQGNQAINNSGAARGMQLSGATLKALQKYGQGVASDEYSNAYNRFNNDQNTQFNRLSGIAGTGQTATNQIANMGTNYANAVGSANMNSANQIGQNMMAAGNARASGYVGQANSWNNAIGTGINAWQQNQMLNRLYPATTSYGTIPGSQQSQMLAAQW
ncbi:MAG: hypothetical protein ACYCZR_02680 [Burkholderiales bacterium]